MPALVVTTGAWVSSLVIVPIPVPSCTLAPCPPGLFAVIVIVNFSFGSKVASPQIATLIVPVGVALLMLVLTPVASR